MCYFSRLSLVIYALCYELNFTACFSLMCIVLCLFLLNFFTQWLFFLDVYSTVFSPRFDVYYTVVFFRFDVYYTGCFPLMFITLWLFFLDVCLNCYFFRFDVYYTVVFFSLIFITLVVSL